MECKKFVYHVTRMNFKISNICFCAISPVQLFMKLDSPIKCIFTDMFNIVKNFFNISCYSWLVLHLSTTEIKSFTFLLCKLGEAHEKYISYFCRRYTYVLIRITHIINNFHHTGCKNALFHASLF